MPVWVAVGGALLVVLGLVASLWLTSAFAERLLVLATIDAGWLF